MSSVLAEHLGYVSDARRTELFREAIKKSVRPGDVVVDLGCGSAILGLLCLQAGASKVIAIDSTGIIDVARDTFARAGLLDKVHFVRGSSFQVDVPERADVLICDHVGYFGFDYGVVELLADARSRFLKPDGVIVPSRLELQLAAVQSDEARKKSNGWRADGIPAEYHWLTNYGANTKHAVELKPEHILSAPTVLGSIDLAAENPAFFSWTATLTVQSAGMLHGLAGWFRCQLAPGVWMTNAPVDEGKIDRPQAFLPIEGAVPVAAGEQIKASVMARPADNLIAWSLELPASGKRFRHSTWQGLMLGAEDLHRANPGRRPRPSRTGRARGIVLSYCGGQRTAREIEELVLREHPDLLPTPREISRLVAEVLARDTE